MWWGRGWFQSCFLNHMEQQIFSIRKQNCDSKWGGAGSGFPCFLIIHFFFLRRRSQKAKKNKSVSLPFLFELIPHWSRMHNCLWRIWWLLVCYWLAQNLLRPNWFLQYPHWTVYTVDCTHVMELPGMNIFSYLLPGITIFINLDDQYL